MIHLARISSQAGYTAGAVMVDGQPICVCIERPWRDNRRSVSCIPAGNYTIDTQHLSPRFGKVWLVMNVPGRDHILWHPANEADELEGCIAPGKSFGELRGNFAVLNSRAGYSKLRVAATRAHRDEFGLPARYIPLRITDDWRTI